MSVELDESFATSLRQLLVEHVQAAQPPGGRMRLRLRWPRTLELRVAVVTAVIAAGGGAAAATGVLSLWPPGSPVLTMLASPVTVAGSGSETIKLGAPPSGANAIYLNFRCLSAGDFTFGDGSGERCSQADSGSTRATIATLKLQPGQDTTSITTDPGVRWWASFVYVSATSSPWRTNADGQTYGVANANGTPDLVAVIATDGQQGYAYANQLYPPPPTSPAQALAEQAANSTGVYIPVYESDGTTVIGRFEVAEPACAASRGC